MSEELEQREDARAARLLAQLPGPSPVVVARVRTRLTAVAPQKQSGWRLVGIGMTTALAAATALFFVGRSLEPVVAPPVAVNAALSAGSDWAIDTKVPGVALSYTGNGSMAGLADAPQIQWNEGTINVEVVPDHNIRLAVETKEAKVRVVGTGFTVARDATLGTTVNVRHGKVEVDCSGELTRVLVAGDSLTCLPVTASGLNARAMKLTERGASNAEILATVDRGLALPDAVGSVGDELATRRFGLLLAMGRQQEALEHARKFVAEHASAPRRAQVIAAAAELANQLGGCATAAPWLVEVAPESCK